MNLLRKHKKEYARAIHWIDNVTQQATHSDGDVTFNPKVLLQHLSNIKTILAGQLIASKDLNGLILQEALRFNYIFHKRQEAHLNHKSKDIYSAERELWEQLYVLSDTIEMVDGAQQHSKKEKFK